MYLKRSKKIFAHIDCDSFFSSCEIIRNPKLKGKKVIVGTEIVIACSYNLKKIGIKTGTPIWEAKKILKNNKCYYFKNDVGYYQLISKQLMEYLKNNTLSIEEFSIDEAFCEITGLAELNKLTLEEYIIRLQKDIYKKIKIPVSIGVSNTRIKAKIFSKINKPYGYYISIDSKNDIKLFKKLKIKEIPYIGVKYQERLKYKCRNIYDFIQLGYWKLKDIIGKSATDLWLELVGVNSFKINKKEIQSISRGRSFNQNITNNKIYLYNELIKNFDYIYEEFSQKNLEIKKVSIFFRNKEFITLNYDYIFNNYTINRKEILDKIIYLFNKYYNKNELYRSTGILFNNFKSYKPYQLNIFQRETKHKYTNIKLLKTINNLNNKFGDHKITFGFKILNKGKTIKLGIKKS